MAEILMILAPGRFKDEEYEKPRKIFERNNHKITIASTITTRDIYGMAGKKARADILLDNVDVSKFDAFVFIGGLGMKELWDNPKAHEIAKEAAAKGKVLSAIEIAPVILARAGVLEGKRATVYYSEQKEITSRGGTYAGNPVVIDGNIVTGKGPESSDEFGVAVLKALSALAAKK